jgi:soluble lytic murein transglycosylase-like protein
MVPVAFVLALLAEALPGLSRAERLADARAVAATATAEEAPLVVALITQESRGLARVCANDRFGGSARGLMGIRTPRSRCRAGERSPLYSPLTNVRRGVAILRALATLERTRHHGKHDVLLHYSGGSAAYVAEVRERVRRLRGVRP